MMLYVNVCYGLLAIFISVGLMLNREPAVIAATMLTVLWSFTEIVTRAYLSILMLKEQKKKNSS